MVGLFLSTIGEEYCIPIREETSFCQMIVWLLSLQEITEISAVCCSKVVGKELWSITEEKWVYLVCFNFGSSTLQFFIAEAGITGDQTFNSNFRLLRRNNFYTTVQFLKWLLKGAGESVVTVIRVTRQHSSEFDTSLHFNSYLSIRVWTKKKIKKNEFWNVL